MTALQWTRLDRQGKGLRLKQCDNVRCSSAARWRLSILAYPAGNHCRKCHDRMQAAWNSALTPVEERKAA